MKSKVKKFIFNILIWVLLLIAGASTLIVVCYIAYVVRGAISENYINAPEGYEKVIIQEKNGSLYLDGLIESEKIDTLLSKNSPVKVYNDTNLSSYVYFTEDDLKDMIITVGIYRNELKSVDKETVPDGYEKVLIQEKNDFYSCYVDGFVESEKIDVLLSKNSSVKVYHDTNLSSYVYFTEDDLKDMIITVGKHKNE